MSWVVIFGGIAVVSITWFITGYYTGKVNGAREARFNRAELEFELAKLRGKLAGKEQP